MTFEAVTFVLSIGIGIFLHFYAGPDMLSGWDDNTLPCKHENGTLGLAFVSDYQRRNIFDDVVGKPISRKAELLFVAKWGYWVQDQLFCPEYYIRHPPVRPLTLEYWHAKEWDREFVCFSIPGWDSRCYKWIDAFYQMDEYRRLHLFEAVAWGRVSSAEFSRFLNNPLSQMGVFLFEKGMNGEIEILWIE